MNRRNLTVLLIVGVLLLFSLSASAQTRTGRILGQLRERTGPDPKWSVVLIAGFLGWIGCAFGFIWRVLGDEVRGRGRRALVWGVFFAGFFLMWIVRMMRA